MQCLLSDLLGPNDSLDQDWWIALCSHSGLTIESRCFGWMSSRRISFGFDFGFDGMREAALGIIRQGKVALCEQAHEVGWRHPDQLLGEVRQHQWQALLRYPVAAVCACILRTANVSAKQACWGMHRYQGIHSVHAPILGGMP